MSELPEHLNAWLNSQKLAADLELDGMLDADAIRRMDMAEWRARRIRAGLPDIDPMAAAHDRYEPLAPAQAGQDPAAVMAAQHPAHAAEDPGVDFQRMTMDQYEAIRSKYIRPSSGSGVGIFG